MDNVVSETWTTCAKLSLANSASYGGKGTKGVNSNGNLDVGNPMKLLAQIVGQ
jgi:hypothetical protein